MTIIAFHIAHFDYRGTGDAIYNYAHYNETILRNKSIIFIHEPEYTPDKSDPQIKKKFQNRFPIIYFTSKEHLHQELIKINCSAIYYLSSGENDQYAENNFPREIPWLIHCVFTMCAPYGTIYAGI